MLRYRRFSQLLAFKVFRLLEELLLKELLLLVALEQIGNDEPLIGIHIFIDKVQVSL